MLVSNHVQMFSPKCIFKQIIETWNSFPIKLHTIESLAVFKSQLKTYYFGGDYFTENFQLRENKTRMRNIHPRFFHLLF